MDGKRVILVAAVAALAAAQACGDDDGGRADVVDTGTDGDASGACRAHSDCPGGYCMEGTPRACEPLPVVVGDMSCLRNNPPPVPGVGEVTVTAHIEDFEDDTPVAGAVAELFFDGVVGETPDMVLDPTNAAGEVPGVAGIPRDRFIAYRVRGGRLPSGVTIKTTIEYDQETPVADGGRLTLLSVSDPTYRLIQTVLGIRPTPTRGVLAGEFQDCNGDPVEGVIVRLVDAADRDCHDINDRECYYRYFDEEYPARLENQPHSSADGLYGAVEVPPGEWTIEILGRLSATTEVELLGAKRILATADAIAIANVGPLAE